MSIFGDNEVVDLVKSKFVPVAVAIGTHGKALDDEGDLYRKIVAQRKTESFQGFYVFDTQCQVLDHEGGSRHDAKAVAEMLRRTSQEFKPAAPPADKLTKVDLSVFHQPPVGGLVVEVTSKMLDGFPGAPKVTEGPSLETLGKGKFKLLAFDQSLGRDRLWMTRDEAESLTKGELPKSLQQRIARFHLVDNTRCFPLFWDEADLREVTMTLRDGVLQGSVHLETPSGDRGYQAELYGRVESKKGAVTRFDIVARGKYWGGKMKGGHRPPKGKFPIAIAFRLSDSEDRFDPLPPAAIKSGEYWE